MTDPRATPPGLDSDDESGIGCVAGLLSGIIGNAIGTAALLLLHPAWLFGDGESIVTIMVGLLPGWGIALVAAVVACLLLVWGLSAITRGRRVRRSGQRLSVVLVFVVPALVAAGSLWFLASVNR